MAIGYHHVTRDERSQIRLLKAMRYSISAIAKQLNRDRSTISREILRNSGKRKFYCVKQADEKAKERRSRASRRIKKMIPDLKEKIIEKIKEKWSPEQISGRFKKEGISISHESIYKLIRKDKKTGGKLYDHLRHRGKRYKKRLNGKKAGRGCIPNRIDISERPKIVDEKSRIGDWEADTIIGAKNQGVIFSIVDRLSKYLILKNVKRKNSKGIVEAIKERMVTLPHAVHTVTFDNGKEFARHEEIAVITNAACYFAKPYHSWERGLNEHSNGLVRQYLPKSSNLSKVSDKELAIIEEKLNNRPRKVLGYRTPWEVFYAKLDPVASLV
ncbi:MAG: IS30 family transposase [Chthoniobacterales bacterium]